MVHKRAWRWTCFSGKGGIPYRDEQVLATTISPLLETEIRLFLRSGNEQITSKSSFSFFPYPFLPLGHCPLKLGNSIVLFFLYVATMRIVLSQAVGASSDSAIEWLRDGTLFGTKFWNNRLRVFLLYCRGNDSFSDFVAFCDEAF